ncbi:hypothetical protein SAMN04515678_101343 [Roseivivax sediminis]|uniref:Uncharacterized protein n=1 Tax=Roseivivax sediminis TaxID=936889 RepID=A0A1I1SUM0_9RHOB|nr:hypothetical protein SAMN04515678_101343 [Roseivivax sediminis]
MTKSDMSLSELLEKHDEGEFREHGSRGVPSPCSESEPEHHDPGERCQRAEQAAGLKWHGCERL